MNKNDLEFAGNMLKEVLGPETNFLLITKDTEKNGCVYNGDPVEIAKSIFYTMAKDDVTSEALIRIMQSLGYNLIKTNSEPSMRFTQAIFDALDEKDD